MKNGKTCRTLLVALALAWLTATLPATPALAAGTLSLLPNSGKVGTEIEALGSGYEIGQYDLYFSDELALPGRLIDTDILNYEYLGRVSASSAGGETAFFQGKYFYVPANMTDGKSVKRVLGGTYWVYVTNPDTKEIVARAPLTLEAVAFINITPESGTVGTEVTLNGEGFGTQEDLTIEYDNQPLSINSTTNSNGKFTTTFIIPESTTGKHTITAIGQDSALKSEASLTVQPKITISPASGAAGDSVSINGTGFGDSLNFSIYFDSIGVIAGQETTTSGSFTVTFLALSRKAGTHPVEATDEHGNSDSTEFTLAPAAISVSSDSGNAGDEVSVSGVGFQATKPVSLSYDNDLMKTVNTDGYGRFTTAFTVPVRKAGTYKIKASDGTNIREADFSVATSTSIAPVTSSTAPGHVGIEVTISGTGFLAGGTITIGYDGNQIATATVKTDGTFSASFKAPAGNSGNHNIIATDGSITKSFIFVMEATPPPTPSPLKPEMGIKAERETHFDWEDVADPSGVTYTLQIATSENFSPESIILEKKELAQSQYTLTKEEILKSTGQESPYYWRARAVDGATNVSQWSGTGAFHVGFALKLPSVKFPFLRFAMFGGGALLIALLGFWFGRRTAYY